MVLCRLGLFRFTLTHVHKAKMIWRRGQGLVWHNRHECGCKHRRPMEMWPPLGHRVHTFWGHCDLEPRTAPNKINSSVSIRGVHVLFEELEIKILIWEFQNI